MRGHTDRVSRWSRNLARTLSINPKERKWRISLLRCPELLTVIQAVMNEIWKQLHSSAWRFSLLFKPKYTFHIFSILSWPGYVLSSKQRKLFKKYSVKIWPPLWSSSQSSWLQIQRSRVRFPALPDFLRNSGSGKGSTQPREDNWGAIWMKK
jgi:hypothetical protein